MRTHHRLGLRRTHLWHLHAQISPNSPVKIPTSSAEAPPTRPTLLGKTHLQCASPVTTKLQLFSSPACKTNQPRATDCGNSPILLNHGGSNHAHCSWFHRRATIKRHGETYTDTLWLLNYVATHPNSKISYTASDMIL